MHRCCAGSTTSATAGMWPPNHGDSPPLWLRCAPAGPLGAAQHRARFEPVWPTSGTEGRSDRSQGAGMRRWSGPCSGWGMCATGIGDWRCRRRRVPASIASSPAPNSPLNRLGRSLSGLVRSTWRRLPGGRGVARWKVDG
jgi:hypothetical protein